MTKPTGRAPGRRLLRLAEDHDRYLVALVQAQVMMGKKGVGQRISERAAIKAWAVHLEEPNFVGIRRGKLMLEVPASRLHAIDARRANLSSKVRRAWRHGDDHWWLWHMVMAVTYTLSGSDEDTAFVCARAAADNAGEVNFFDRFCAPIIRGRFHPDERRSLPLSVLFPQK